MPVEPVPAPRPRGLVPTVLTVLLGLLLGAGLLNPPAASADSLGAAVVARAATYYGAPYVYGATGPTTFDCSGFTGFVYRQFGISLPRTSSEQYGAVTHLPQDQKQLGDLIFTYDSGGIYHVGIYGGNNQVWAATHTGDVVRSQTIWTSSYLVGRPAGTSPIDQKWAALGGAGGVLGQPLDREHPVPGGSAVDYQAGAIYWSAAAGAREVHGQIAATYGRLGGPGSAQGLPVTDETGTPDRVGRFNHFSGGSSVYWSPSTGAHGVQGLIRAEWAALGWESGPAGYPLTDELPTPDGTGRFNHFSRGASIYWTPATGAHEVRGEIRAAWAAGGWETGRAGYPVTDETVTPDGVGRYNHFSRGASIYWTAATGAHQVGGAIRTAWLAGRAEAGALGYPVSDEYAVPVGRAVRFQHGTLTWSSATGRVSVRLT